ncbi:MAG: hypothetical protein DI585_02375 [Pseudomonas fluorescens]|nr:MAG: hypothetical protein DI585_02375 [Pseudomonas fluorescens]
MQTECIIYNIPVEHMAELIEAWVEALLQNKHHRPEGLPLSVGVGGDMGMKKPEVVSDPLSDERSNVVKLKTKAPPPRTEGRITLKTLLEAREHVAYKRAKALAYYAGFRLDVGANWSMKHALGTPSALEDAAKKGWNPLLDENGLGGMVATEFTVVLLPFEMAAASKLEAVSEIK